MSKEEEGKHRGMQEMRILVEQADSHHAVHWVRKTCETFNCYAWGKKKDRGREKGG